MNLDYVPFDLVTPDQKRADVWIAEHQRFVRDGNMPQLELMWLPMAAFEIPLGVWLLVKGVTPARTPPA